MAIITPKFTTTQTTTFGPEHGVINEGPFRGIVDLRPAEKPQDENLVTSFYPLCNEADQDKTLGMLQPQAQTRRTVHIGFSINFNYDLIAHRGTEVAIVADIAPPALKYYQDMATFIKKCTNRKEFAVGLQEHMKQHADSYFGVEKNSDISCFCDLIKELTREGSWLSTDEGFQRVKQMHEENRILYLDLNITDRRGFDSIWQWIKTNQLTVDTIYVSNIPEWLHPGNQVPTPPAIAYINNIGMLIQPQTYVIDAFKRFPMRSDPPAQRLFQGKVELPEYSSTKKTRPNRLAQD